MKDGIERKVRSRVAIGVVMHELGNGNNWKQEDWAGARLASSMINSGDGNEQGLTYSVPCK